MTLRLVAAVFETSDGETVTIGDSPARWSDRIACDALQHPDTEITLDGADIDWWLSTYEAETDHPVDDEDRAGMVRTLRRLRSIEAEARRILAAYAPLRAKEGVER